ncbi:hypothetical protein AB0G64_10990 [Streptomyces longwoodensis]|uniref:hypothetical protein n=1 Tax=Streptomyces longwoodensis TaxID=68231 RepID=UPI0033CAF0C6
MAVSTVSARGRQALAGRVRRVGEGAGRVRSALLDVVGLGLLATGVFTWSVTAGFLASGVGVLAMNWRLNDEGVR